MLRNGNRSTSSQVGGSRHHFDRSAIIPFPLLPLNKQPCIALTLPLQYIALHYITLPLLSIGELYMYNSKAHNNTKSFNSIS